MLLRMWSSKNSHLRENSQVRMQNGAASLGDILVVSYKTTHTLTNSHAPWVSEVAQLCLTLCDPMGCSLPGSSHHGILQARILEWLATSFSRDLPNSGIEPRSPALKVDSLTSEPPGKTSLVVIKMNWKLMSTQILAHGYIYQLFFFLINAEIWK